MVNRSCNKRGLSKSLFALSALALAMFFVLGFFRFNSAQLEHRLSGIERSIARYTTEESELRKILSGLTSPIKIYDFSREHLGMIAGTQEIVHVRRVRMANTALPEPQKGWRESALAFFGFKLN